MKPLDPRPLTQFCLCADGTLCRVNCKTRPWPKGESCGPLDYTSWFYSIVTGEQYSYALWKRARYKPAQCPVNGCSVHVDNIAREAYPANRAVMTLAAYCGDESEQKPYPARAKAWHFMGRCGDGTEMACALDDRLAIGVLLRVLDGFALSDL